MSDHGGALFAIASASASKSTILSSDTQLWETLDFVDIDMSLAGKLRDTHIRDILTIIDASNNTKRIRLTGCVNIDGSGLSPLRDSIVLQQLDLGLVGQYKSSNLDPEPLITEEAVVPILTSIINTEENSMTHLQLPQKWRNRKCVQLNNFLETYNNHLARRQCKCKACDEFIDEDEDLVHVYRGELFGIQNYICYKCLESFCDDACSNEDGIR